MLLLCLAVELGVHSNFASMQHSLLSQALFPLDKKSFLQLLWLTIALHVVQQYSMGLVVIKLLHFSHMQNYVQIAENQSTGLLLFGGGE